MTYNEYKQHLEACGPLDEVSKGLLSAFELGYAQGLFENKEEHKEEPYPYLVLFAVEQAIRNGSCYWEIEKAFKNFEEERKGLQNE